jgi:hypothetical protein
MKDGRLARQLCRQAKQIGFNKDPSSWNVMLQLIRGSAEFLCISFVRIFTYRSQNACRGRIILDSCHNGLQIPTKRFK